MGTIRADVSQTLVAMPLTDSQWLDRIRSLPAERTVKIMNVCGGHERSITNDSLDIQVDAASITLDAREVIFSTDGFTVQPLEFPGGERILEELEDDPLPRIC